MLGSSSHQRRLHQAGTKTNNDVKQCCLSANGSLKCCKRCFPFILFTKTLEKFPVWNKNLVFFLVNGDKTTAERTEVKYVWAAWSLQSNMALWIENIANVVNMICLLANLKFLDVLITQVNDNVVLSFLSVQDSERTIVFVKFVH